MEAAKLNERREKLRGAFETFQESKKEALVIDFDEAKEEYQKDHPPIKIKFEGKVYEAPESVTTEIMLFIIESMDNGVLSDEQAMKLLPMIFGDEITAAMKKSKAPFPLISEKILEPIMKYWGFDQSKGYVEEKNVTTPDS